METPASPAWPEGRFEGRDALLQVWLQGVRCWQDGHAHAIWCSSPDWDGWPWDHPDVLNGLQACMQAGATLRLLALDYRRMHTTHPRFVAWRALWSHRIEARGLGRHVQDACPSLCWSASGGWELLSRQRGVLVSGAVPKALVAWQERYSDLWDRASAAFPSTTLGL